MHKSSIQFSVPVGLKMRLIAVEYKNVVLSFWPDSYIRVYDMLIILLFFTASRLLYAAPVNDEYADIIKRSSNNVFDRLPGLRLGTRNTSDIVTSCLLTVFACTWTAVHPNIPSPTDSRWDVLKRRILTTIYAFIAPEAIMCWALWQRISARRIANQYNEDIQRLHPGMVADPPKSGFFTRPVLPAKGKVIPWTMTHGFFVQMGGFMLSDGGVPIQTLAYEAPGKDNKHDPNLESTSLRYLIEKGCIDRPHTTEKDILDRSKGDIISKSIAVLQTSWFVAQCIARFAVLLPVTELEIVTLGFAFLNGITYFFWLYKPKEVGVPVYLELKSTYPEEALKKESTQTPPLGRKKSFISRNYGPLGIAKASFRPFDKLISGANPFKFLSVGALRVPMFHVEAPQLDLSNLHTASIVLRITVVYALFGLVHLIPVWFPRLYPSVAEEWIWRGSALLITVPSALLSLSLFIGSLFLGRKSDDIDKEIRSIHVEMESKSTGFPFYITYLVLRVFVTFIPFCFFPMSTLRHLPRSFVFALVLLTAPVFLIYTLARLALVVLAFLSLRDVPHDSLITIDWLASVPHL